MSHKQCKLVILLDFLRYTYAMAFKRKYRVHVVKLSCCISVPMNKSKYYLLPYIHLMLSRDKRTKEQIDGVLFLKIQKIVTIIPFNSSQRVPNLPGRL